MSLRAQTRHARSHRVRRRPSLRGSARPGASLFAAFCLGFAALAFGAFGSGGAHAAPAPLLGKHYSSTAVTGTPIPGGGPLVIDFPSAGRIALTAGCNRHIGSVRIEGSTMRIGPLMSTRMACPGPRAGADAWLANFTKAPLNWYSVGQALVLTGPTNQVLLTEGDS